MKAYKGTTKDLTCLGKRVTAHAEWIEAQR